jgi:hypothetical protein
MASQNLIEKKITENLYENIWKLIREGKQDNTEILLMRDFNQKYKEYLSVKLINIKIKYILKISDDLENMIDPIKILNK